MAHRCRTCAEPHFSVATPINYPNPEELVALEPVMLVLLEAAREFMSFGEGNALEFVEWLAVDVRRSTATVRPYHSPAGRPGARRNSAA